MKYFKYLAFLLPFLASNVKGAQAVEEDLVSIQVRASWSWNGEIKEEIFEINSFTEKDLCSSLRNFCFPLLKKKIELSLAQGKDLGNDKVEVRITSLQLVIDKQEYPNCLDQHISTVSGEKLSDYKIGTKYKHLALFWKGLLNGRGQSNQPKNSW